MNHKRVLKVDPKSGEVLEIFSSIRQAALSVNGTSSSICNVCIGKGLTAYGYVWQYANSESKGDVSTESIKKGIKNKQVYKIDVNTGETVEVFDSCTLASESVKLTRQAISYACLTGKVSRGYIWSYNYAN